VNVLALAALAASLQLTPAAAPSLNVEQYSLDNGLTVLLSHDDRLPVVAVEVRYLVGSAHEVQGRTGFAHLFEHLMFQGSANFDDEYFKPFAPLGAKINGTTSNDRTNYYQQVPSQYLEQVLWMESDRMENLLPALTLKKLNNQRDVVKNERRQNYEDRPYGVAWGMMAESLYPKGHPYHHLTIGSHADLTAATLDDVKKFFMQYYVPANAVITIVGDFDKDATKKMVEKYFGHIPKGNRAPTPKAALPKLDKVVKVTAEDEVKLPRVYFAWNSPAIYKDGDAALDVLSTVLTDGKSSRLYKALVYDKKVAKDVAAYQVSRLLSGFYVVQATAAKGVTVETLTKALEEELGKALATPPTADEFNRVLNGWRKNFYGGLAAVLSKMQLVSTYYHFTGDPNFLGKDLARYTRLDPAKVHAAAKTWLPLDKRVELVITPKAAAAAPAGGAK